MPDDCLKDEELGRKENKNGGASLILYSSIPRLFYGSNAGNEQVVICTREQSSRRMVGGGMVTHGRRTLPKTLLSSLVCLVPRRRLFGRRRGRRRRRRGLATEGWMAERGMGHSFIYPPARDGDGSPEAEAKERQKAIRPTERENPVISRNGSRSPSLPPNYSGLLGVQVSSSSVCWVVSLVQKI